MAWRNGGGETRELSAWPRGAGLEAFEWRVSVATIARSGPFSRYPGVTRTAVLVDGRGLRLVDGAACLELAEPYAQVTFAGDPAWQCELMEGPVEVLNVMVRSSWRIRVHVAQGSAQVVAPSPSRVAYAATGTSGLSLGPDAVRLHEGDACDIDSPLPLRVTPAAGACAVIASIAPAGTP